MKAWISIVLISVFSVVCFGSCQSTQTPPKDSSTEIVQGEMPNESSGNDTVTVATPTGSPVQDANNSLKEQHSAPDKMGISYRTDKGRMFRRAMLDLLKANDVVPFHIVEEKGRTYLLFDQGEDISDEQFEKALKNFDRIDSKDITILTDPNVQKVVAYPTHEYYIFNGRLFVTGTVILEGEKENDEDSDNEKEFYSL